jgi:hypothetical protein
MNKQILTELAEQAGHRYYPSSNSGPLRVEYLTPELEKFAELIVQECANRATWAQDTGAADIGGEVLKHFGVEE